ncbi:Acyl dehydratase [Paraburkholderia caribensis MBA4]|uniref:Acyl dehydratase n=1 Tax=Paraburkholderia caribensis MBA4 TaxID=1323664 RepID=A0A0P0R9M7_9BURK|nr:MaoC/PaaZ C-terminal domain-containing protein [Paraburkholderia caribensis]ALL64934.1 Acyl dehydratase [Paraburkholderia caribensis MBA4]
MALYDSSSMFGAPRLKTVVLPELPKPAKLYARALTGVVKGFQRNRSSDLPLLRLVRPAVSLDSVAIERYARVCGFFPEQGIPFTFPHLLAFPLHLLLLTDPAFPWSALGLVHLANSVHMRRPLSFDDTLRVEVEFGARLRHDKGQAFVLQTRVYRRGEAVWDGDSVYLKRGVAASGDPLAPLETAGDTLARAARWQLPSQLGRDYAKASGDFNPIHLSMLSAKAFGFPRAIAHGMWTLARTAAALQPPRRLADATLAGEFKLPMLLPGEASLWTASPSPTAREFEVRDPEGGKPHLRGRFQWNLQ